MIDDQSESHDKIVFKVNEYSKEFEVNPLKIQKITLLQNVSIQSN